MSITVLSDDSVRDIGGFPRYNLDIIAVHGLNGNYLRTWTEPKSRKLWLRDFLSVDLPGSRVMSFGYNATPAFANTTAGIREHARTLLVALIELRDKSNDGDRPLIFIGHSLGGLVIKQALIFAQHEKIYATIYNQLQGIIFFGTPHQGSSLAKYAMALTRIPLILANKPNPKLLEALRQDSQTLKKLTNEFRRHHEARPYPIVTFYETRTLQGLKILIVESTSALLTPADQAPTYEDQIPVDANHREMCRFASVEDKTYMTTLRSIKRLYRGYEPASTGNEVFLIPDALNRQFTGRVELCQSLENSLVSCRRVGFQQRIVLHGLGGSGKTQISLKFVNDHRQQYRTIFFIDASSRERAAQGFLSIARACKLVETVESVKEWLSSRNDWLLLVDNCDDPALDISTFFPSGNTGAIIITTRNPDLQKYATAGSFRIGEMDPEDAITLLLKSASVASTPDADCQVQAAKVAETLGYLALAIVQAAAVIRQRITTLAGFCELFNEKKKELLDSCQPCSSDQYHYSVFTTWDISVQQIETFSDESAQLALELLQIFAFMHFDNIQESAFKRAARSSEAMHEVTVFQNSMLLQILSSSWDGILWGKAMSILVRFSLITIEDSDRISLHPLVHEWSRVRMTAEVQALAWQRAIIILGQSINHAKSSIAHLQRRQLLPHIEAAMAHENGQMYMLQPDVWIVSYQAENFMDIYAENCQFEKIVAMASEDLKSKAPFLPPDHIDCVRLRGRLAEALSWLARYDEATELCHRVIADLKNRSDNDLVMRAKITLCRSTTWAGEHQKALDMCSTIKDEYKDIFPPDDPKMLLLLQIAQLCNCCLGNHGEALNCALEFYKMNKLTFGPTHSETINALHFLAASHHNLKHYDQAWTLHEEAFDLFQEILGPDHGRTKGSLQEMARIGGWLSSGQRRKALKYSRQYFESLRDDTKDPDQKTIDAMKWLADDYYACGELIKARALQEEVVKWSIVILGEDHKDTIFAKRCLRTMKLGVGVRKVAYCWLPKSVKKV